MIAFKIARKILFAFKQLQALAKQQNPDAVVAIIIDAADNAMIASDLFNEECFLKGLLRQALPEGVFLIVTTRTERTHLIPFNDKPITIDLLAFNLNESSQHIRSVFNDATDAECKEFHLLSDGNPRMQSYLLSGALSITDILLQIKPNGKTMESLFKGFVSAVKVQYDKLIDVDILFAALTNLPRPIPIGVFCKLLSLSQDALNEFLRNAPNAQNANEKENFIQYILVSVQEFGQNMLKTYVNVGENSSNNAVVNEYNGQIIMGITIQSVYWYKKNKEKISLEEMIKLYKQTLEKLR